MRKKLLTAGALFLSLFTQAQTGLDGIIVEKYYISTSADVAAGADPDGTGLPAGSVTYRVYVDMDANYKFLQAYGEPQPGNIGPLHTLKVRTTTSFFNNIDRGNIKGDLIGSGYLDENSVALDSWYSAGAAASGQFGVLKSEDNGAANLISANTYLKNTDADMGIPLTTEDGIIAGSPVSVSELGFNGADSIFDDHAPMIGGDSMVITSGSFYNIATGAVGPTSTNRVLIGQFTTDGIFHFELNIQLGVVGSSASENWVASNPQSGEYTHPSLIYTSPTPGGSNTLPTVSITSPASSATFTLGSVVAIAANASDTDGTADSVEFFVDGTKVGSDLTSPYTYNWTSAGVGTHTLTAVATDNDGGQTTSSPVTITVTSVTAINSNSSNFGFTVFPNPTNDVVTLKINTTQSSEVSYTIYNTLGSKILNKNLGVVSDKQSEVIDLSALASGFYIVEVSINNIVSSQKIIKN